MGERRSGQRAATLSFAFTGACRELARRASGPLCQTDGVRCGLLAMVVLGLVSYAGCGDDPAPPPPDQAIAQMDDRPIEGQPVTKTTVPPSGGAGDTARVVLESDDVALLQAVWQEFARRLHHDATDEPNPSTALPDNPQRACERKTGEVGFWYVPSDGGTPSINAMVCR
jgi:hypothetical protein